MKRAFQIVLAGIACAMIAGCQSTQTEVLEYDAAHPLLRFSNRGMLFRDRYVTPKEAVQLLEKYEIPKDKTLHILVDADYTDRRAPWVFQHNYLGRAGYRRTILVHARKATSSVQNAQKEPEKPKQKFRYKGANED